MATNAKIRKTRSSLPRPSICRDIYYAITSNNVEKVKQLLDLGVPVDYFHSYGSIYSSTINDKTPLMLAASFSREKIIDILLDYGADVTMETRDGMNALMYACSTQHSQCSTIEKIISLGVDINKTDSDGNTALAMACRYGNLTAVDALLSHENIVVNKRNRYGDTALDCSCRWNTRMQEEYSAARAPTLYFLRWSCLPSLCVDVVRRLISRGADVNKQSVFSGETPLHCLLRCPLASWYKLGEKEVTVECALTLFKEFLSLGAHVDVPDFSGVTFSEMVNQPDNLASLMTNKQKKDMFSLVFPLKLTCLAAAAVPVGRGDENDLKNYPKHLRQLICMHKTGGENLLNI